MELRRHQRSERLHPTEGYSHAVTGHGRLVAISGQVPLDESGALIGAGDAGAQADQVFANLGAALNAAGASFNDVVKLTYFLTSIEDWSSVEAARDRHIDRTAAPASTLVEVQALFRPEVRVEVEAWAVVAS